MSKTKNVLENFEEVLTQKNDFESQSFALFDKSTHGVLEQIKKRALPRAKTTTVHSMIAYTS